MPWLFLFNIYIFIHTHVNFDINLYIYIWRFYIFKLSIFRDGCVFILNSILLFSQKCLLQNWFLEISYEVRESLLLPKFSQKYRKQQTSTCIITKTKYYYLMLTWRVLHSIHKWIIFWEVDNIPRNLSSSLSASVCTCVSECRPHDYAMWKDRTGGTIFIMFLTRFCDYFVIAFEHKLLTHDFGAFMH